MEKLSQAEREELLKRIKKASGVALYALRARMTDKQLIELSKHLDILLLIKDANNYNRRHQGLNTQRVNQQLMTTRTELVETRRRLDEFLNIENSEILKAGRWLIDTLALSRVPRRQILLEKNLVHKEDYNQTVSDMRETIETINSSSRQITEDAEETIQELENRIDILKGQMLKVRMYIIREYGESDWESIEDILNVQYK